MNRTYSWKPPTLMDDRDFKYSEFRNCNAIQLPASASNIECCSPIENQGRLGSCTSNAWAGLLEYNECKLGMTGSLYYDMSRLFIYYNTREKMGTIHRDSGASLRDGADVIAKFGVCSEKLWEYDEGKFTEKPIDEAYVSALPNHIHNYYSIQTLDEMKTAISNGQCFVFGFLVYPYFESPEMAVSGVLRLPSPDERCMGGHAVMAVGYDDSEQMFLIRNSWGKEWGRGGYFKMPYEYIGNPKLASDFWTLITSEI